MTENSDELNVFADGDNIGISFFSTAGNHDLTNFEQPALQSPPQVRCEDHICLNDDFVTDRLGPNDCLSDETHFEGAEGSNGNSNNPSPTKSGTSGVEVGVNPGTYMSQENVVSKVSGADLLNQSRHLHTSETREGEIDIAEFIDNFLGDDDLMHNIPEISDGLKLEKDSSTPLPAVKENAALENNALDSSLPTNHIVTATTKRSSVPESRTPGVRIEKQGASPERNAEVVPSQTVPGISEQGVQKPANRMCWSSRQETASSTQVPVRRSEKRKPRTYSQAVPSQHCHICSRRPTEGSPHQVCGNLQKGRCRKTICTKCFHQFRWDLTAAREAPPGTWECPHCRGQCPQRAQCVIYNRTSDRRRLKLINHRKRKSEDNSAPNGKKGSHTKKQAIEKSNSPNSGKTTMPSVPSLSCDKSAEKNTTGGKARSLASNPRKGNASKPKPKKNTSKAEEFRKGGARSEANTKAPHLSKSSVENNISRQMLVGQRKGREQQSPAQGVLERATMMEQTRMLLDNDNNNKMLQEQMNHVFISKNDASQANASYTAKPQDSPNRNHLANPSVSPHESSLQVFGAVMPPPAPSLYNGHPATFSGDSFLSMDLNVPLAQTEISLGQELNNLQHPELIGRIQPGLLSVEDIWPKATMTQHGYEVSSYQEAPEDLWMLTGVPSDSISDAHGENALNMLDHDVPHAPSSFLHDRLRYHGTGGIEEKGALRA